VRGGSALGAGAAAAGLKPGRVAVAARDEPLRTVVERLALPGVRRLVVVQRGTGRVEGVVSLSDVAALLFM
jgi:5'-AMP-activated protein kinase regulatory gamma subunit